MKEDLKTIRQEIDQLDDAIIPLLEKRFLLIQKIQKRKEELTDNIREEEILKKTSSPSVENIYKAIFTESKKIMSKLLQ